MFDAVLLWLCIFRIVCALPRPYYWLRTRRDFIHARYAQTPQLVAVRLERVYSRTSKIERFLLITYYVWLVVMTILLLVFSGRSAELASVLWRHVLLNYLAIIVHRTFCVVFFYWLMRSDFRRGIPKDVLDKYTKVKCFLKFLDCHFLYSARISFTEVEETPGAAIKF